METVLSLGYLVQYVALVAVVASVGALVVSTVNELVRNRMSDGAVLGSTSLREQVEGSAS